MNENCCCAGAGVGLKIKKDLPSLCLCVEEEDDDRVQDNDDGVLIIDYIHKQFLDTEREERERGSDRDEMQNVAAPSTHAHQIKPQYHQKQLYQIIYFVHNVQGQFWYNIVLYRVYCVPYQKFGTLKSNTTTVPIFFLYRIQYTKKIGAV